MMNYSRLNYLLKYSPLFSRTTVKQSYLASVGETSLRAVCSSSPTKQLYSKIQYTGWLGYPTIMPAPQLRRYATTITAGASEAGFLKRMAKKIGWLDHSKGKLRRSGFQLYESIGKNFNVVEFIEVCDLPDTFFSWFLVTEIHIWMLMVRLMAEGEEGRFVRNSLVEALWEDVPERAKKIGDVSPSARRQQIDDIGSSFQVALFTYDEGLLGDDKALAGALWRRLFMKECSDPERLECCIQYIRKNIAYLDSLPRKDVLLEINVKWLPLLEKD